MKKSVFIISLALILLSGTNLSAQKHWYLSFNAGYAFKMSSQNLSNDFLGNLDLDLYNYYHHSDYDGEDYSSSGNYEQVNASLGKGINFALAAGYMFNDHWGVELGVSYLLGGKTKATHESSGKGEYYDYEYDRTVSYEYSNISEYSISARMFRINPSLLFCAGYKKVNPYAKFGLILGMGSIFYEYTNQYENERYVDEERQYYMKMKMNKGLAVGCNAALGVMFNIGEHISLFGEVNAVAMSYAPKKGTLMEYTVNGIDELNDLTTSEKEIDFVKDYSFSSDDNDSDYEPSKSLKYKYPFGSIGVNVGIRINF